MQTAIKGQPRPKTPPQLRLPTTQTTFQPPENSDLNYNPTNNGILISYNHQPIAWIFSGWAGSRQNPKRCTFHDVAYPTLTTGQQNRITGIMLDTASFDTLPEAVQFIETTFAEQEATR